MAARIIARSPQPAVSGNWQAELRAAYREPRELLADLGLAHAGIALDATTTFPFRVTRAYAARMRHGDPHDALLRQVLPLADETTAYPAYGDDPVGEFAQLGTDSLLRKYAGRALLVVTGACAIHCRYCFRRAFPYQASLGRARLERAIARIAADPDICEVILSGGDPLVLEDDALAALLARLAALPHIRRVRVHTRLPVVLPSRITPALLASLTGQPFTSVLVVHVNHPQELDPATVAALAQARAAGLTALNQAVLLAGVNDDVEVLANLSERLFEAGVLPYYLHLLDRVTGTRHFAVPAARARELEHALRARLPGYLVPRVVREIDGATAKVPLAELPLD